MIQYLIRLMEVCALVMILLPGGTQAQTQAQTKLTYSTFYNTKEFFEISARYFMDEVTKRTNGRVSFETYYNQTLLKAADTLPGLAKGAADIAVSVPYGFNPREFPISGVALPFISENPIASTKAFRDLLAGTPAMQKEFERNNMKYLWSIGTGENTLWTRKPIRKMEDLQGARIRSILGIADALKVLGAVPVSVPWVEALELMQRGGVEGVSTTPFHQSAVAGTLDVASYGSNGGRMGNYGVLVWGMNLDTWKKLDDTTKRIVEEVSMAIPDYYLSRYNKEVDVAVAAVKASKVQYIHLDDAEVNRWKEKAAPVIFQRWIDFAKGTGVDCQKLLDDFVALVRKHEKTTSYVTGFDRLRAQAK